MYVIGNLQNGLKLQESNRFPALMTSLDLEDVWQFDLEILVISNLMLQFLSYKEELQSETLTQLGPQKDL